MSRRIAASLLVAAMLNVSPPASAIDPAEVPENIAYTLSLPSTGRNRSDWKIPVYRRGTVKLPDQGRNMLQPVHAVSPLYPVELAKAGVEGYVCFLVDLSDAGAIEFLRIYDAWPLQLFDNAAATAIVQWRFSKKTANEVPGLRQNQRFCFDFKMEE